MNFWGKLLLGLTMIGFSSQGAQAFELGAIGGLNWYRTSATATLTSAITQDSIAQASYAVGLMSDFTLVSGLLTLEPDLIYAVNKRKLSSVLSNLSTEITTSEIQMPLLLRIWPFRFLSIGAGPFFGFGVGSYEKSVTGSVTASQSTDYSAAQFSKTNFGGIGSIQLKAAVSPGVKLFLDGRAILGATDLDTSSGFEAKSIAFQALTGISFQLSGGGSRPKHRPREKPASAPSPAPEPEPTYDIDLE